MTNNLLYQSMALHISGLTSLTFIFVLYLKSKNDKSYTARTFIAICFLSYLVNFSQMGAFTFKYLEEIKGMANMSIFATICARLFIFFSVLWGAMFERYFMAKFVVDVKNDSNRKKLNYITFAIAMILFAGSFFFGIKYHTDSERFVLNGPFSIMTYISFGLGVISLLISFIKNIKSISFLKGLNLSFVLLSFIFVVFIEKITNFDISEVPYILCLYTLTMYFTLENTDYVKIQKLRDEEQEAEKINNSSIEYVNNFSNNMMVSINNAFLVSSILNNKEMSEEELLNNIKSLQGETNKILETINSIGDVE